MSEMISSNGKPLPVYHCPVCGYTLDAATDTEKPPRRPRAGDVTLCAKCGELLIFDESMRVREPQLSEMMQFDPETNVRIVEAQNAIRAKRPIS